MLLLTLTGCFGELFASRTLYLATEYTIEHPRIVGLSVDPPRIEPGQEYTLEWLLLTPAGGDVGDYALRTCALGREVTTYIGDLNCFQDPDEVNEIAQGSGASMTFTPLETPVIEDCGVIWWDSGHHDSAGGVDSGSDSGARDSACAHQLPLLLEGSVDRAPVFAAGWVSWYTEPQSKEMPTSFRAQQIALSAPESAGPGEAVEITLSVEGDHRSANFYWYVDGGELERTGWTVAHGFVEDDAGWPEGLTTTSNVWTLPEDGSPRIAVVVSSYREGVEAPDNHWAVQKVEIR